LKFIENLPHLGIRAEVQSEAAATCFYFIGKGKILSFGPLTRGKSERW
jgi:hypothetical protein